jgi:hypothetical protein
MLVKNAARKSFVHQILQREELTKIFLRAISEEFSSNFRKPPKELQEFFFFLNEIPGEF